MDTLRGLDERSLTLDSDQLTVRSNGDLVAHVPLKHLKAAKIRHRVRKDMFGNKSPVIRLRLGPIATVLWIEPDREDEVHEFVDAVDRARGV